MPVKRTIVSSANLLLIFEVAGRHLSFSRAAQELGVSQPAVSHAIKKLERELGAKLFERQHRGVTLSRSGKTFFNQLAASLDDIYQAAAEIKYRHHPQDVTLSVSTAFATHWLMPRIARFKHNHPSINLRCLTTESDIEQHPQDVDLRIPLGGGDWPGYDRCFFTDESVVAVCSSSYLHHVGPVSQIEELAQQTLLHLEASYLQRLDWQDWLGHYGVPLPHTEKSFCFNDYSVVLQAALEGQGVALGWLHIVEPLLDQGRLVQITPNRLTTSNPFYILSTNEKDLSPAAECLRNWLVTEVNGSMTPDDL